MKRESDAKLAIHNRFDIVVTDAKTGEIKQKAKAYNVVLDKIWTYILGGTAYFNYIHYGSGSGTPAATDTSLFTFVAAVSAANAVKGYDKTTGVYSLQKSIVLSETQAVGVTFSEVGIAQGSGATTLVTHAMLEDMNGNPITITKTNVDILTIYATIFCHPTCNSQYVGVGNGSTVDWGGIIGTAIGMGHATMVGGITSLVGGTAHKALTKTTDLSAKTITFAMARGAVADWNIHGIPAIYIGALIGSDTDTRRVVAPAVSLLADGSWNQGSDVVNDAIGTGDGSTKDFSTNFDCPENATVYVDGVEAADVIVENTLCGRELLKSIFYNLISCTEDSELGNIKFGGNFFSRTSYGGIPGAYVELSYNRLTNEGDTASQDQVCVYNPFYELCSIASMNTQSGAFQVKDGIGGAWRNAAVGDKMPFIKIPRGGYSNGSFITFSVPARTNVHFASAPAAGAVITADYHTQHIAKDANHVLDISVTIQFGEYTE